MTRLTLAILVLLTAAAAGQTPGTVPPQPGNPPWRCGEKTYCTQMTSCEEAMFHFRTCGVVRLDGDRDGVPCERLCGGGRSTRRR